MKWRIDRGAACSSSSSVFIDMPNEVSTLDYQITKSGADYEFSGSRKPLEKHRANITAVSGLYHPHGMGHHHNCSKIWLTGGKLGQGDRHTISVDQLLVLQEMVGEYFRHRVNGISDSDAVSFL